MKKTNLNTLIILILTLFSSTLNAQNGEVIIEQPKAIDQLLEYKKDIKTVAVYKIQVFNSSDSFKAESVKAEFKTKYGEWPVSMEFNTPNYKIWVGNFRDRLEADRALLRIKQNYMNAFIFQPTKD